MIRKINLSGKIVQIEFILLEEIKKFLQKNNIDENQLLKDYSWEDKIIEDLTNENQEIKNDFGKAKLVINYIHISQNNQIRVKPENFAKGKRLITGNWTKGSFFEDFSIGYSIFVE